MSSLMEQSGPKLSPQAAVLGSVADRGRGSHGGSIWSYLMFAALSAAAAMAAPSTEAPGELPPYNTFAPFWIIGEGYNSFVMVNNTAAEDRPFTLAVYDVHGRALSLRQHLAPGNGSVTIPIKDEAPSFRGEAGYAELLVDRRYQGQFPAQMVVVNPRLRVSSAAPFDEPRNHWSRSHHAAFWLPQPGSEMFLVALNRDDRPVKANVTVRGDGGFQTVESWTVPSGQMRTLRVELPAARRSLAGVVEVATSADPGSILVHGFVVNGGTGFSATLEWQDPHVHATEGFMSLPLVLTAFEGLAGEQQALSPHLLLSNLQPRVVETRVSLVGGEGVRQLRPERLDPFESRVVVLGDQLARETAGRFSSGALELEWNDGGPVAAALWNVGESWDMVVQSRVLGRVQMKPAHSLPFRLGGGWNTQVYLTNRADRPVVFCVFVNHDGRFYTYGGAKELLPFQSLPIDIGQLRDDAVADEFGRTIDPGANVGQIKVIVHDVDPAAVAVQGLLVNAEAGVSIPVACSYCPAWDREIYLSDHFNYNPAFIQARYEGVKGTLQRVHTILELGDGNIKDISRYANYSTTNSGVATVKKSLFSNRAEVDFKGAGAAFIDASYNGCGVWNEDYTCGWGYEPENCECQCGYPVTLQTGHPFGQNPSAYVCSYQVSISGPTMMEPGNAVDGSVPSVRLTVDLGKSPPQPRTVSLRLTYLPGSGRHTHDFSGNRPNPMLRVPGGPWRSDVLEVTTTNRTFQIDFQPPRGTSANAGGISGSYPVKLDFLGIPDLAAHQVEVRYDLSWLGPGGNFHKRMNDPNHSNGDYHYAQYPAIQMTVNAATRFYEDFGKFQSSPEKMVVNDISIEDGGLFDIGGNWDLPHQSHRDGRHVDIPYRVYRNSQDVLVSTDSASWLALRSTLFLPDGSTRNFDLCQIHNNNHWHCQQGSP